MAWKMAAVIVFLAATAIASSAQVFTTLFNFDETDGTNTQIQSLAQGTDGNFYGTTSQGGRNSCPGNNGCGTVFGINAKGVLKTLYDFCVQPNCADGAQPLAGLVLGTDGRFYGTTFSGGGGGTLFKFARRG
jgi:uncharacterized repeat protein (TIGR03803 family)